MDARRSPFRDPATDIDAVTSDDGLPVADRPGAAVLWIPSLTDAERELVFEAAKRAGTTAEEWSRRAIVEAADRATGHAA
jgi:hypothetical protein